MAVIKPSPIAPNCIVCNGDLKKTKYEAENEIYYICTNCGHRRFYGRAT